MTDYWAPARLSLHWWTALGSTGQPPLSPALFTSTVLSLKQLTGIAGGRKGSAQPLLALGFSASTPHLLLRLLCFFCYSFSPAFLKQLTGTGAAWEGRPCSGKQQPAGHQPEVTQTKYVGGFQRWRGALAERRLCVCLCGLKESCVLSGGPGLTAARPALPATSLSTSSCTLRHWLGGDLNRVFWCFQCLS